MSPDLVAGLLAWAATLLGVPRPVAPPPVVLVPQAHLADLVCQRPCPVRGYYARGVVYLADTLDPESMPGRATLVHELVHVLQEHRDGPLAAGDCVGWAKREMEAAGLESTYLLRHGTLPASQVLASVHRGCGASP